VVDDLLKKYKQPEEYHFSQESIELVKWSSLKVERSEKLNILDVGAGCGVLGIEWFYNRGQIDDVLLVEKQNVFSSSLSENIKGHEKHFRLIESDFIEYKVEEQFDVILCNPPYFLKERSRPGPSYIRNTCRQIDEATLKKWFFKISEILKTGGHFFFVFRDDELNFTKNLSSGFSVTDDLVCGNYRFHEWKKKEFKGL
jgi:tRNA1(Val) A37 N6-methylase TrmN6